MKKSIFIIAILGITQTNIHTIFLNPQNPNSQQIGEYYQNLNTQQIRPQYYQNPNSQQIGEYYQQQINRGLSSQIAISEENKKQLENQKRINQLKYELHLKMSETQNNLVQIIQLIEECRRINSDQSKKEKKYHKLKKESYINTLKILREEEKLIAEMQKIAIDQLNFSHIYQIGPIQIKSNQKLAKADITLAQPFLENKHNLHLLVTPSENNIQKIQGQTTMNARQLKVVNSNTTNPAFMITQKELDELSARITHYQENKKQILQEQIKKREKQLNKLGNFTYEYTVSTNAAQTNAIKSNHELTQQDIVNINYFISKYPGVKMEIAIKMPNIIQRIFQ